MTEVALGRARMKLHLGISVEISEELGLARTAEEIFVAVDAPTGSIEFDHRRGLSDADWLSVESTKHVAVQSFGTHNDEDIY